MARIFPENILRSTSYEVARVFRSLKRLPSAWKVWHNLIVPESESPDFLLLNEKNSALLLKVSTITQKEARQAPQLNLLDEATQQALPGELETHVIEEFMRKLKRLGLPTGEIAKAIIFPNMKEGDVRALYMREDDLVADISWLSKEWLAEKGTDEWGNLFISGGLAENHLRLLRGKISPECRIPHSFTSKRHARNLDASLGDYLLDYDQEYVLKTDLDLDLTGEQLSRDFRVQVVNGVAGSGKTLILLFRLKLLKSFFPRKRFLVLTHNRALIREMRARYMILSENSDAQVKWFTFMGWCRSNWPDAFIWKEPISPIRRHQVLKYSWSKHLHGTGVSEGMLESEMGWVKDNDYNSGKQYLKANRRGRGFRLNTDQRQKVSSAIYEYQRLLREKEEIDWWDVPKHILAWIREGIISPTHYDVILVDEAQFFASLWFDIIRLFVKPKVGYLFMAADPSQGFLRRGNSWKSVSGIEVRGKAHVLTRSYRTTQSILNFAVAFYKLRLPDSADDFPSPDFESMPKGKRPKILHFATPQDERARVINEIKTSVENKVEPKHILVMHASWKGANQLTESLQNTLGREKVIDPKENPPGDSIRVTTINAGTGLECPLVFVCGLNGLFEKEGSLKMDRGEREERIKEHTKKLYMAFTRAGQRLVLTYVGKLPESLVELAERNFVEIES